MMDNGHMARWIAQTEHFARNESQKRQEAFLRDIQSDDFDVRVTQTAGSKYGQPASVVSLIKKQLASFSERLEPKRAPNLDCTEAGYEKNCV